ncbi:MAG TPA: GAF domain-containing protein [Chloroflexota bacterium]|jgi:signal transduction protein with GAF and PtsI domain|nr:GAF domain-containing protein [Chloroflexota bacterium]
MDQSRASQDDALEQARASIARQAQEIDLLQRQLANNAVAEELREALRLAATAATIAAPVTSGRLLDLILETAAQVIRARAGALFLIDEHARELVFEATLGQKSDEVKKFTVPIGRGIAGLVAATGQPMAISDAQSDARHAADIASRIGYLPQTIMCVPLLHEETVIGVLELLDKEGAASFSPADMSILGLFAEQAAVAIQQSRMRGMLADLLAEALTALGSAAPTSHGAIQSHVQAFIDDVEEGPVHRSALDLARLVREIAQQGEDEMHMCVSILGSVAAYGRSRRRTMTGFSEVLNRSAPEASALEHSV